MQSYWANCIESCIESCIKSCIESCIENSGVQESKRPCPKLRHYSLDLCRNDIF